MTSRIRPNVVARLDPLISLTILADIGDMLAYENVFYIRLGIKSAGDYL
ncbi:MAG: hypothetical protein ABL862_00560 [Candidatus Nitrotoga sp.]